MIDMGQRYERLCLELGHLELELEDRRRRREVIVEELKLLRRLARGNGVSPAKDETPSVSASQ